MSEVIQIDDKKKKHAILSPSGADRWMMCPGSVSLSLDLPNTENEYSIEGTDYHEVAAVCLEENTNAADYVGMPMLSGALVTEENAAYLQRYIDLVRFHRDGPGGGPAVYEDSVPIDHLTGEEGAEGTVDAAILKQDPELVVIDLKFGRGVPVYAENNRQGKIYALGLIKKHSMETEYETVRIIICQPRIDNTSEWVIPMRELLAFGEEVAQKAKPIMDRLLNPSLKPLPLVVDDKACRFCKAANAFDKDGEPLCKALAYHIEETLTSGFINENTGKGELKLEAKTQKPVINVRGKRLGELGARCDLMEDFIKAVRAQIEIALLNGEEVEGWKLVQGKRGNRKWSDEEAVLKLFKKYRLKKDVMYHMDLISPTDAEKLFKENPTRWEEVKENITQSDGVPSVAPASDKRPPLNLKPTADGFSAVTDEDDLLS